MPDGGGEGIEKYLIFSVSILQILGLIFQNLALQFYNSPLIPPYPILLPKDMILKKRENNRYKLRKRMNRID